MSASGKSGCYWRNEAEEDSVTQVTRKQDFFVLTVGIKKTDGSKLRKEADDTKRKGWGT